MIRNINNAQLLTLEADLYTFKAQGKYKGFIENGRRKEEIKEIIDQLSIETGNSVIATNNSVISTNTIQQKI